MSDTYFRLQRGTRLPLHWAYGDPTEQDEYGRCVDIRSHGFQVWPNLSSVLSAAAGEDRDGSYAADEYPLLLIIRASSYYDGVGEWLAIRPSAVTSVRVIRVRVGLGHVIRGLGNEYDADLVESWVDENEKTLLRKLVAAANRVPIQFEETLSIPRRCVRRRNSGSVVDRWWAR